MTKAKDLAAELLEIGRQNRELLVELRQERKALKDTIREAKQAKEDLRTMIDEAVDNEKVTEAVRVGLEEIKQKIEQLMEVKTEQIGEKFQQLGNLFMFGNTQGRGQPLEQLIIQRRADEQEREQMFRSVQRDLKERKYT